MPDTLPAPDAGLSRRDFLRTSAAATAGLFATQIPWVHAAGNDVIRVGVVGLGGRGSGAIHDLINGAANVQIVAVADLFPERTQRALDNFARAAQGKAGAGGANPAKLAAAWKVTPETCFTGFDGYKKLLAAGIDMVILATPPGFRPIHFKAAVEAGKHVFMEKPVATCPTGIRMVMEAAKVAQQKGLSVVAGTQRRHTPGYIETIRRIHAGDIGEVVGGQVYWNTGGAADRTKGLKAEWSELEQQCYNWYPYLWICGDHIVEQHVHNLDVMNWVFSKDGLAHPVKCLGVGGRQVRGDTPGNIWDHFVIEYEYANGARIMSMCRHWPGPGRVAERFVGTRGETNCADTIIGEKPFKYAGRGPGGYVQEHTDLVASIRAGKPINEGEQVATSTLIAIMGRMAAYTGKEVTWEFALNESKLSYLKEDPKPGACPVDPVAVPGKTQLI